MKKMKVLAAGLAAAALIAAPMSASAQEEGSIAAIAVGNADFSTLVAALSAADLVDTFATCDGGPFTVFAPTNDAFNAALSALGLEAADVLGDTELLTSILTYHVVDGAVDSGTVVTLDSATTLQGEDISIEVVDGSVVLNGSVNVTTVDIEACNGIIHVIDFVLVPPTILEALTAEPAPTTTVATPDPAPELAATGSSSATTALFAGLLLLGGAAMIGASRRRVNA
jgi:transforming growth factor-beta-induced protein